MTEIREPRIKAAAEKEMLKWSAAQQVAERLLRFDSAHEAGSHKRLGPFITISRQAGCGAEEIAHRVGEKLGWHVIDKNVLDAVAQKFCLDRGQLDNIDEAPSNWVRDIFGPWLDPGVISSEKFLTCLERVVWMLARRGQMIFVGRGIRFVLPDEPGLAVRLVASEKYRVNRIQREKGMSEAEARRFVQDLELARQQFVQRFFHKDVNDPQWYDVILNVERWGVEATADLIVAAWRNREASRQARETAKIEG